MFILVVGIRRQLYRILWFWLCSLLILSDTASLVSVYLLDSDDENFNSASMHEIRPIDDGVNCNIKLEDLSENDASSLVSLILCDADDNDTTASEYELRPNTKNIELDVDDVMVNSEDQAEPISENNENVEMMEDQNSDSQSEENDNILQGRRIVDIKFLFKQVQTKGHNSCCHFEDIIFEKEEKKGLNSMYQFQCGVCGLKKNVWSCKEVVPVSVNDAAVLGITAVGLGSYHLNEICTNVKIPCMSNYKFDQTQKKQQHGWWLLAKQEASDALMEEMRLAKIDGKVDAKGNALITVVVDGSWPKRSYNKNFTSLSGCAVIIGMRTNKVLYFDVKDKYCHVCKIARSKNVEPRNHECNTNYRGPSSSMETTIVVEGFQYCETLGARFNEFVADGDSSTYKTICDKKIYQNPDVSVEQDECCNHLYRNFRKAFEALTKATKKFGLEARKHITKKKANDICLGVQTAAKHWRNANVDTIEKLTSLEKDVLNAPMHYFGIHDDCEAYYCTKKTEPKDRKVVAMLKSDGIFNEILNLCQSYFASSVPSLLLNYNNNMAESFNNLIAKYTGFNAVTLGQHLNRKWRDSRKKLLTSYYFSQIVNARSRKSYKGVLEDIMYKNTEFSDTIEHRHQKIYEQKALWCFGQKYGTNFIAECGLIIDIDHCFLATSPFRLFGDNGIIVIKCPQKAYKHEFQDAVEKKLIPLYKSVSGVLTINKASAWFIEIQGQLHITSKAIAYVVIWLQSEFKIQEIYRDDDFWYDKMESPLVYFYEQVMIKELVDPRKRRSMPARSYDPLTKTFV